VAVNRMPAAEVEVSADLVRRLLAGQHPDLARLPVEFLANGWDNELYRVGDRLIARLPRRALGAEIIKNEQRWLPGLAPGLPLPIPYPERTGVPACGYPYSWSVVPYLPGVPAAQARSFDPAGAAAVLGGFLGALHVPAPADAPANPFRGVPLAERAGSFAANLALLTGQASPDQIDRDAVLRGWDAALAVPRYDGPPVWLHGDLHPANILVNDGQVSGVIDFGDITAGDPARRPDPGGGTGLVPADLAHRLLSGSRRSPARAGAVGYTTAGRDGQPGGEPRAVGRPRDRRSPLGRRPRYLPRDDDLRWRRPAPLGSERLGSRRHPRRPPDHRRARWPRAVGRAARRHPPADHRRAGPPLCGH
jgi:hypothetical protein